MASDTKDPSRAGWAGHRPLSRVAYGTRVPIGSLNEPATRLTLHQHPPLPAHTTLSWLGSPATSGEFADSCYSSCSESESHSSLSRNTSAASETLALAGEECWEDSEELRKLADFATKLGFSDRQLSTVLHKLPGPLNQERHGRKEVFSCQGIRECVDFFRQRGHEDIKVFVPQYRREATRPDSPITDQELLTELEKEGILVWTPSRRIGGRRVVCHDDRYILKTAMEKEAVIVSNDEYRDLMKENPEFRQLVEERLLMYSFVDGKFMPPDDPLGRSGPSLDAFLRKGATLSGAPLCPYGRKCTYGNKCKFAHPERAGEIASGTWVGLRPGGVHVSVTQRLRDRSNRKLGQTPSLNPPSKASAFRTHSLNPQLIRTHNRNNSPSPKRENQLPEQRSVAALQHNGLSRQYSNPEAARRRGSPRQPPPQAAWPTNAHLTVATELHQSLVRNRSAPGTNHKGPHSLSPPKVPPPPLLGEREGGEVQERVESVSDSQLDRWGAPSGVSAENPLANSNLFIPSSAVWGPMEFSVSPVWPRECSSRERLLYHLSQLFPSGVVRDVLAEHPSLSDPHQLCALILSRQASAPPPSPFQSNIPEHVNPFTGSP